MSKKISIMLIDDNKIDLFIFNEFIKQMNIAHTVLQYSFATDALNFLKENEITQWPDLILLDIHMPVMSGFDFLDNYVSLPEACRQKCNIIVVSSSLDTGDKLKANEHPEVIQLLEKPLNTNKLRDLLESKHII